MIMYLEDIVVFPEASSQYKALHTVFLWLKTFNVKQQ